MGLVIKGNDIVRYKVYIRDINSLKGLIISPLFSKGNKLDLGPVFGFLFILSVVKEFLIMRIYIRLKVIYIRGQ